MNKNEIEEKKTNIDYTCVSINLYDFIYELKERCFNNDELDATIDALMCSNIDEEMNEVLQLHKDHKLLKKIENLAYDALDTDISTKTYQVFEKILDLCKQMRMK